MSGTFQAVGQMGLPDLWQVFQNGKPSWSVAGGRRWITPQIVRFVSDGPRAYIDPGFATGTPIHSANLGDFSMALRKANGVVIWPLCKITKIPRIALVILPLQNICRLESAYFIRVCDSSISHKSTIPAIAADNLGSQQVILIHNIHGAEEQLRIFQVWI